MSEAQQEKQSDSKNFFPIIVVIGLIAFGFLFYSFNQQAKFDKSLFNLSDIKGKNNWTNLFKPFSLEDKKDNVIQSYEFVSEDVEQTPFSLLVDNAEVEYDQYDFGVFVKAINQQASNSDYYWALYVNEEYAQAAADQIELTVGDKVEWRWEPVQDVLSE